jgi:hypothetical protein
MGDRAAARSHAFAFNERNIPCFQTRVYLKLSAVAETL